MLFYRFIVFVFSFLVVNIASAALVTDYLPNAHTYSKAIPTPESHIGFELGNRHVRYDQLLSYFKAIDNSSPRIQLTHIGKTHQLRDQVLVTISSADNLKNLDRILDTRNDPSRKSEDEPLVIWLGYSVHGDELSGANAAMVVAYHLAASQDKGIEALLQNTIVVFEPSINPDGMDRFVSWVNDHRGTAPNADPNHIEHHQGWRTGRSNHFGFDLNRDWLLFSQIETINRMPHFQRYQPHVVGDFHEMESNHTYFFQPGISTRNNPLTAKSTIQLTHVLAKYHAKAFDQENRLYFSEEKFDDFYYGKGSTYADINGAVGILFEQASSRGMQMHTTNGLVTLEYGIKNHVLTSLSTIEGAAENKLKFIKHQKAFYNDVEKQAKKEDFKGYIVSEKFDSYRLQAFLEKLALHQIKAYALTDDFKLKSTQFEPSYSYYIPLLQPKYKVIKALFDTPKTFKDNSFYDVSGWTLPLAMNIDFHEVDSTWGLSLSKTPWQAGVNKVKPLGDVKKNKAYAYVFDWKHFLAPKLLNQLHLYGIKTKVATEGFTANVAGESRQFNAGSIIVPAGMQTTKAWSRILQDIAQQNDIDLVALFSGLTTKGIDLGSPSLKTVNPVKVLLVGGKGVSELEAGEVKFYLDDTLHIATTVIEKERLHQIDLNAYTHVIMVNGHYYDVTPSVVLKLENWVKQGGVLFAQKQAAKWLADKDLLRASFVSSNQINQLFDSSALSYKDKQQFAARKRIAGAIYEAELDTSHPLAFGFTEPTLPMFKNSTLIMEPLYYPFTNIAVYSETPLLSGYTDKNLVNRIANTSSFVAHNVGKGRIIATTSNLAFRGYWYGSVKLLANSLFFGKAFSAPTVR